MPVFEQGYRSYVGPRRPLRRLWWPIARRSFAASIRWPFFVVLVASGIPLLVKVVEVYATGAGQAFFPGFRVRHGFGDGLFLDLFSQEILFTVLLLSVTGAGQIADDLRSGALTIYFARPIRHADYVGGKLLATFLTACLTTAAPALALFLACVAFAPDWSFLTGNPWLPAKAILFGLFVAGVLSALTLAVSSLARNGRAAMLGLVGGYVFTMVLSRILRKALEDSRWEAVHLGRAFTAAGSSVFTVGPQIPVVAAPPELAWGFLLSLALLALLLLTRRVEATA